MTHRPILLVGSIPCQSSAEVFRLLARELGGLAPRYPDGETGNRIMWVRWQKHVFEDNPDLRLSEGKRIAGYQDKIVRPFYVLKDGVDMSKFAFKPLGYADEAIKSYAEFKRLKAEGVISAGVKFQVSIPTAISLLSVFVEQSDCLKVEPPMETAMKREVEAIAAAIPAGELAIQWDAASEVIGHDGGGALYYKEPLNDAVDRLARYVSFVPAGVEAGIHLCYGDPGHKHVIEPKDAGTCVAFANAICRKATRKVDFIHLPIPRGWDRADYYKPLANLDTPAETEIYLGLIHFTDGAEGTSQRLKLAREQRSEFGIATECGFGRRDPSTVYGLLGIHRDVANAA